MSLRLRAAAAALCVGAAFAGEEPSAEHKKWMKDLGSQMGALRKGVDVEKNATDMHATLKHVGAWWESRKSEVANKSVVDSVEASAQVAKAAKEGDTAGVSAGMKVIGGTCKSCHDLHREKVAENVYLIK